MPLNGRAGGLLAFTLSPVKRIKAITLRVHTVTYTDSQQSSSNRPVSRAPRVTFARGSLEGLDSCTARAYLVGWNCHVPHLKHCRQAKCALSFDAEPNTSLASTSNKSHPLSRQHTRRHLLLPLPKVLLRFTLPACHAILNGLRQC